MRKNLIALGLVLVLIAGALVGGYAAGIHRATTAEGWIDEDPEGVLCFFLDVNGNLYAWDVSEECWGSR